MALARRNSVAKEKLKSVYYARTPCRIYFTEASYSTLTDSENSLVQFCGSLDKALERIAAVVLDKRADNSKKDIFISKITKKASGYGAYEIDYFCDDQRYTLTYELEAALSSDVKNIHDKLGPVIAVKEIVPHLATVIQKIADEKSAPPLVLEPYRAQYPIDDILVMSKVCGDVRSLLCMRDESIQFWVNQHTKKSAENISVLTRALTEYARKSQLSPLVSQSFNPYVLRAMKIALTTRVESRAATIADQNVFMFEKLVYLAKEPKPKTFAESVVSVVRDTPTDKFFDILAKVNLQSIASVKAAQTELQQWCDTYKVYKQDIRPRTPSVSVVAVDEKKAIASPTPVEIKKDSAAYKYLQDLHGKDKTDFGPKYVVVDVLKEEVSPAPVIDYKPVEASVTILATPRSSAADDEKLRDDKICDLIQRGLDNVTFRVKGCLGGERVSLFGVSKRVPDGIAEMMRVLKSSNSSDRKLYEIRNYLLHALYPGKKLHEIKGVLPNHSWKRFQETRDFYEKVFSLLSKPDDRNAYQNLTVWINTNSNAGLVRKGGYVSMPS